MSTTRPGTPGATRTCPHCSETILESAAVCPACRHHVRFDATRPSTESHADALTPLRVEGQVCGPQGSAVWEYSMVLSIRDENGKEIARRLVGVGALEPGEHRTFTLNVEMLPVDAGRSAKRGIRH